MHQQLHFIIHIESYYFIFLLLIIYYLFSLAYFNCLFFLLILIAYLSYLFSCLFWLLFLLLVLIACFYRLFLSLVFIACFDCLFLSAPCRNHRLRREWYDQNPGWCHIAHAIFSRQNGKYHFLNDKFSHTLRIAHEYGCGIVRASPNIESRSHWLHSPCSEPAFLPCSIVPGFDK